MNEPTKISVCIDCLMIIANGETADWSEDQYADWAERVSHRWPFDQYDPATLGGEADCFSQSECDYCGEPSHGDRSVAYVFERSVLRA